MPTVEHLPPVAHVVTSLGPGGVARAAAELLVRLPAQRYLYCLAARGGRETAAAERAARLGAAGVVVRVPRHDDRAAALGELAGWLRRDRIGLVHTHSTKPNRRARPVARAAGALTVAHFHNTYDDVWSDPAAVAAERRLAPVTDGLLACSDEVRARVADRLGLPEARLRVIANGVDPVRVRDGDGPRWRRALGVPDGARLVGTVGRLCRQKGQDEFLAAAAAVARRVPDARFALVGAADHETDERDLRALAAAYGLADRVVFTGFVEDVAAVYAALDVLVSCSRWEGFGLVPAEALAAGVPVVATAVGPVPDVLGDAARLVPPGEPAAVADTVDALLADPAAAAVLASRGRLRATALGWDGPARELAAYYRLLLGSR